MLRRAFSICKTGKHSQVCVVLGAQWGDEGKGKLVDILAQEYDIVGRFNGGSNAGHTIVTNQHKFAFHMLPCGLLYPQTLNIIGNGVVVDFESLFKELKELHDFNIDTRGRLMISDRAHIVLKAHTLADRALEASRGTDKIGTTGRGIGPTYTSKAMRIGVRVGDLLHWESFKYKYDNLVDFYERAYGIKVDRSEELGYFERQLPYIKDLTYDTIPILNNHLTQGKRLIAEGANALMLDLDYGTYPFVTSSSTGVAGVGSGLGIAPNKVQTTIGVVKAYTTRVGGGPFPTEIVGGIGDHLQKKGQEWGVTTGRKRRCGWLDMNVLRYTHMINGYASINITKLDILDELPEIKIGVGYTLDGKRLEYIPSTLESLARVVVEYETLPGWQTSTEKLTDWNSLPTKAQDYLKRISQLLGIPVSWVGTGPHRENILLNPSFK